MKNFAHFAAIIAVSILTITASVRVGGAAVEDDKSQDETQALRWKATIQKFDEMDKTAPPKPGGVVFVGSSSIRKWDVERWFPGLAAINRGFGGSQISDVNYYIEQLVLRHAPRAVVFYSGDNDIASGKDATRVFNDFKAFADQVHRRLPKTQVIVVPIKPSLARWKLWPEMQKADALIRKLADEQSYLHYADTAAPMLGDDGQPRPELFVKDGLHLSDDGYRLWTEIVRKSIDAEKD
jgi:lysophospholipase L1-like esterase